MFQQQFLNVATRYRDHPAVIDKHGNVTTYGNLLQNIEQLRARLQAVGLHEGDVVATHLDNSTGYVALLFALASLGLVHCPVNQNTNADHRAMRLTQVNAALLVTESGIVPEGVSTPGFALYSTCPTILEPPLYQEHSGLMRMQETSGSTGTPKLALWRQDRLFEEITHWVECAGLNSSARYLNLHTLDGGHAVDLHVFPALLTGATLYLGEAEQIEDTLQILKKQRITVMSALPSQYLALAQAAQKTGTRLPELTHPFCGGAYLDNYVVLETERWLGVRIKRIYGSTEFGMILANFSSDLQVNCGMYPVGDVSVTLAALDLNQPDIGEIIACSTHSGSGCFPLTASSASVVDVAYHTGDIAQRLEDGSFMLLGRINDAILTSHGTQFAPVLEGHIAQALMIEQVVVLVDEHDHRRAHVVIQTSIATAHEKHSALLNTLKQLGINASIVVINQIPLTPTGKPDRMHLRKLLNTQQKHTNKKTLIYL